MSRRRLAVPLAAVALLLCPPSEPAGYSSSPAARAGWIPSETIDGPADIVKVGGVDLGRDGNGAVVYLRRDGGIGARLRLAHLRRCLPRPRAGRRRDRRGGDRCRRRRRRRPPAGRRLDLRQPRIRRLHARRRSGHAVAAAAARRHGRHRARRRRRHGHQRHRVRDVHGARRRRVRRRGRAPAGHHVGGRPAAARRRPGPSRRRGRRALARGGLGRRQRRRHVGRGGRDLRAPHHRAERFARAAAWSPPQAARADSPEIDIEDDGSFAWVVFRQDLDGSSQVVARRLVGSQFEAPAVIGGPGSTRAEPRDGRARRSVRRS